MMRALGIWIALLLAPNAILGQNSFSPARAQAANSRKLMRTAAAPGQQRYHVRLDIGPLRQYWEEDHGYCGEMSLQQAGAYFGHWISQRAARRLAGGEVLIAQYEGENMWPLVKRHLHFNHTAFRKQPVAGGGLQRYIAWFKQSIMAGMPAILAARIEDGESEPPEEYDHLMPLYGFSSTSLDAYQPDDTLTWTTGNQEEITRSVSDPEFAADGPDSCEYGVDKGGCFNSNPDTNNNGIAIAGLYDAHRIYMPTQLVITGWSDGTPSGEEPRKGDVLGSFMLNFTRSGPFKVGDKITVYRFKMVTGRTIDSVITSGKALANLSSPTAVQELCQTAQTSCKSHVMSVTHPGYQVLTDAQRQLGHLVANSVVFFIAVRGDSTLVSSVT